MKKTKRQTHKLDGWLNVNKPAGMGSTDVVRGLKRALSPEKIGHAGTLDPLADGVLPIALGEATKTVAYMMDAVKTYVFTITWGRATATDDAEGDVIATSDIRPSPAEIAAIIPAFIGTIWQTPPAYSAIKVDGQRAYDLARAGEEVELKQRLVTVYELELLASDKETARFQVVCGKGTYVRSLARDIAEKLGTKGFVSALCRTKVGVFSLENAISLDIFENLGENPPTKLLLEPVTTALVDIPALSVTEAEAQRLRKGLPIILVSKANLDRLHTAMNMPSFKGQLVCTMQDGTAVAMARVQGVDVRPERVFNL